MPKSREQSRRQWIRASARYRRLGHAIFRRHISKAVSNIPLENLKENNYQAIVDLSVDIQHFQDAYIEFYLTIGAQHGDLVFSELLKDITAKKAVFANPVFVERFRQEVQRWASLHLYQKIVTVRQSVVDKIIQLINKGMAEQMSIVEIRQALFKLFRSPRFYRWQIDRIVRTETTAAANFGAIQAGDSTGVPLVKEWISIPDSRTRRRPEDAFDHRQLDGVKIPQADLFRVPGIHKGQPVIDNIAYPGDPQGYPGNVINCRCTIALVPKRDSNNRLILRSTALGRA